MKTIYKYEVFPAQNQLIVIPKGGEILSVGVQNEQIQVWVLVNPEEALKEKVSINFGCTGVPDEYEITKFIGRIQLLNDSMILHVFEGGREDYHG